MHVNLLEVCCPRIEKMSEVDYFCFVSDFIYRKPFRKIAKMQRNVSKHIWLQIYNLIFTFNFMKIQATLQRIVLNYRWLQSHYALFGVLSYVKSVWKRGQSI